MSNKKLFLDETPLDLEYWKDYYGYSEYESYCKETEKKLKTDPKFAFKYAEKNGRLAEDYEKIFLKSSEFAFLYSYWVIKGKLPSKIEKVFEKNPVNAYLYSVHIYKGKLPKNLERSFEYCAQHAYRYSAFIEKRLDPSIERVFIKDTIEERDNPSFEDFYFTYQYSKEIIKGKFPESIHKSLFLRYSFDNNCSKLLLKKYFEENQ